MTILINGIRCNNPNKLKEVCVDMWFKTDEGYIAQVKYIDTQHPQSDGIRFAIVYSIDNITCWGLDRIVQTSWNPEDLKSKEEKFKDFLNRIKDFQNNINKLIESYSHASGNSYKLTGIEVDDNNSCITINLEYYKYQQSNSDCIVTTTEIFYNDEMFKNRIDANEVKAEERKTNELKKQVKEDEEIIKKAKKILEDAGIDTSELTISGAKMISDYNFPPYVGRIVTGNNYRD